MTGTSSSGTASGMTAPSMIAMRSETSRRTNQRGTRRAEVMASSSSEDASFCPRSTSEEIAQGHLCFRGDFAQGSTLALADAAQDIAQFAAQQRGFAQCLFHTVTVAVLI